MQAVNLPIHVDDPLMVLFWESTEASVFIIYTFTGFLFNAPFLLMAMGFLHIQLIRKFREGNLQGAGVSTFYWYGVPIYNGVPDRFQTRWV